MCKSLIALTTVPSVPIVRVFMSPISVCNSFIEAITVVAVVVSASVPNFASKASSAACVSIEIGLFASVVSFTFPRPTIALLMPVTFPVNAAAAADTVPVNVGFALGAFSAI